MIFCFCFSSTNTNRYASQFSINQSNRPGPHSTQLFNHNVSVTSLLIQTAAVTESITTPLLFSFNLQSTTQTQQPKFDDKRKHTTNEIEVTDRHSIDTQTHLVVQHTLYICFSYFLDEEKRFQKYITISFKRNYSFTFSLPLPNWYYTIMPLIQLYLE